MRIKEDGMLLVFIHYRRLSVVTARDTYTIPRMDDRSNSPADVNIFTTLDLNSGYW